MNCLRVSKTKLKTGKKVMLFTESYVMIMILNKCQCSERLKYIMVSYASDIVCSKTRIHSLSIAYSKVTLVNVLHTGRCIMNKRCDVQNLNIIYCNILDIDFLDIIMNHQHPLHLFRNKYMILSFSLPHQFQDGSHVRQTK